MSKEHNLSEVKDAIVDWADAFHGDLSVTLEENEKLKIKSMNSDELNITLYKRVTEETYRKLVDDFTMDLLWNDRVVIVPTEIPELVIRKTENIFCVAGGL